MGFRVSLPLDLLFLPHLRNCVSQRMKLPENELVRYLRIRPHHSTALLFLLCGLSMRWASEQSRLVTEIHLRPPLSIFIFTTVYRWQMLTRYAHKPLVWFRFASPETPSHTLLPPLADRPPASAVRKWLTSSWQMDGPKTSMWKIEQFQGHQASNHWSGNENDKITNRLLRITYIKTRVFSPKINFHENAARGKKQTAIARITQPIGCLSVTNGMIRDTIALIIRQKAILNWSSRNTPLKVKEAEG